MIKKNDKTIIIMMKKTSKNEINEEWIKIWVKGNMIGSLKI
jgi:hypothetical protein